MSFRKRNEPLAGTGVGRGLGVPRNPLSARTPAKRASEENPAENNRAVRPSSVTSQPTVSTGTADLDRILVHGGLPLGQSLLVEESGTTDFSLVLLRAFAAQGIVHNRRDKKVTCHVVVVGALAHWAKDLPGEYKGSSKEQKKAQLARDQQKVNVSNVVDKDMKIAWRYGLRTEKNQDMPENQDDYNTQFDITQRLVPGASAQEMSFVPIGLCAGTLDQLGKSVKKHVQDGRLVRIVVPGLLNPSLYPFGCTAPTFIVPFLHGLKSILSQSASATLMASLPVELFPRDTLIAHMAEQLMDGVVHLQPFNMAMAALIERAYKNEPAKIQQGFVHVVKIPVLSDRGMMMEAQGEYAFKNGRKKFEIEEWGIPVEEEEEKQTTKEIDF